jgi:hypothetical protein
MKPPDKTDYNWTEVFAARSIDVDAIQHIAVIWEDRGDFAEWSGALIGVFNGGRWFSASGWCDTTGWGCQDGTSHYIGDGPKDVWRNGLTNTERDMLGKTCVLAICEQYEEPTP